MSLLTLKDTAGVNTLFDVTDAGAITAAGAVTSSSNLVASGLVVATSGVLSYDSVTGDSLIAQVDGVGGLTRLCADSGVVAVATGGAATSLTLNVPAGAKIVAVLLRVTTTIAGIDSTTGTVALTGGSTTSVGTISAFSAGTSGKFFLATADGLVTGSAANATFTLSGGADNTPSAGAIRLVAFYEKIDLF